MTSGVPLPPPQPNLTARSFAPASRQTIALEHALRRTWIPVARNWRMTPRGLRMLQRATEPPKRRVPVLAGSVVEHLHVAGVPAEWVRGPRALGASAHGDGQAVVLYLHGGGYVFGSPRTHRNLVSRISHVTGLPVLALDYRLPPVATLPAPIEDALATYRHLLDEGHAPERIVVAGDSAGGHLALTLALHVTEAGLPAPAALVLLSPWSDLGLTGASIATNAARDPFLPPIARRRSCCARCRRRSCRPARRRSCSTTRRAPPGASPRPACAPSCRSSSASRTCRRCGAARPRPAPPCARSAAS
jgi:monoterpene epsilon-lactone hydrolase